MAMLVGHFDESGVHDSAKATCIAGLVGTAIEWSRIEKPWSENLHTTGVTVFHASECENPPNEKSDYFGIARPLRDSLRVGLANAIAKRHLTILAAAMMKSAWEQAPRGLRERFTTPYHFCFEFLMQQTVTWARKYADGEPVALVFADHQEYKGRSAFLHELYMASEVYSGLGSLTFGKPAFIIPLQAADFVCYETYHYMNGRNNTGRWTLSPHMEKWLPQLSEQAGFYDEENIQRLKPT